MNVKIIGDKYSNIETANKNPLTDIRQIDLRIKYVLFYERY